MADEAWQGLDDEGCLRLVAVLMRGVARDYLRFKRKVRTAQDNARARSDLQAIERFIRSRYCAALTGVRTEKMVLMIGQMDIEDDSRRLKGKMLGLKHKKKETDT